MTKKMKWLLSTITIAVIPTIAFAQGIYTTPAAVSLSEAGGPAVTMDIKSIGPSQAQFTWTNAGANFLIAKGLTDNCPSHSKVKKASDESGKGTACNLAFADAPEVFAGLKFCVTVAGPNTWAGIEDNRRYDMTKVACGDIKGGTVAVPMGFAKTEKTYGLTPLVVKPDGTFVAWGWHGFGPTRYNLTRPNQVEPDLVTLVRVTADGTVRAATPAEHQAYNADYACFFGTSGQCAKTAAK